MHIYAFYNDLFALPYGYISRELHYSHVESKMYISDITRVKNWQVLVSENTLIKRFNWMHVYFAQAQYAPDRVPLW